MRSGSVGGGFDVTKVNYIRMYSQAGSVSEAFTLVVDKVVFVNPKNMPTPNYETGATGNEFGVTDIVVASNCGYGEKPDRFSKFIPMPPTGLMGPICFA